MYGVGLILGAGIYVLIGAATAQAGNAVWISFSMAAIVSAFTGLSYAELSSIYPKAAAEYVYVKNVFQNNFAGFIVGWLALFTAIVSVSTIALGFAGYFASFVSIPLFVAAIAIIGVLSFVNFWGIKESSWMNIVFTSIEAAGLAFVIFLGFYFAGESEVDYTEMPFGITGIFAAFLIVFFAYIGFENIANISEETKNPTKTIPTAIILSVVITSIIYILVAVSAVKLIPWEELAASNAPLADLAQKVLGKQGHTLLSAIALFATANTVLIMSIASSRILYGISKGKSFPSMFGLIHKKRNTPWVAIALCMGIAMAFASFGDISLVANITVFTIVVIFAAVNFAVIWLRLKRPDLRGNFRIPGTVRKIPIIPVLGLLSAIAGVMMFEKAIVVFGSIIIGAGVLFYTVYTKKKGGKDFQN